jgi:hypothetical protein
VRKPAISAWAACTALLAGAIARGADPGHKDANAGLAKWAASVGGNAALASIHSIELNETTEDATGSGPLSERALILEPDRVRVDAAASEGRTLVLSFDGRSGWREVDDLGFGVMSAAESRWLVLSRDPAAFAKMEKEYTSCVALAPETRNGVVFDVYLMQSRSTAAERWYFDSSTGLLTTIEGGVPPAQFVSRYSDYRRVGAVLLPFEFQVTVGGRTIYSVHRKSISLNVPLTQAFFSPMLWETSEAARAQAILDRYKKACGGTEAAASRRSRVVRSTVYSPATGVTSSQQVTALYPRKILIDSETKGMGRDIMGYDGTTGWAYSEMQGYHVLKPSELPSLYLSLSRLGDPMIDAEAPLRRVIGARLVANRKTTALSLSTLREPVGVFYFDDENGHLLRVRAQRRGPSGLRTIGTVDFSDFRTVGGQDIPFEIIETTASLQVTTKIQSVEDNVAVDESIFKPRSEDEGALAPAPRAPQ